MHWQQQEVPWLGVMAEQVQWRQGRPLQVLRSLLQQGLWQLQMKEGQVQHPPLASWEEQEGVVRLLPRWQWQGDL